MKQNVKENINSIDANMKKRIEKFKDSSYHEAQEKMRVGKTKEQIELMNNYSHFLKKTNESGNADTEAIFMEMERLKISEKEARLEVIKLQDFIRKQRMFQKLREVVTK